MKRSFFSFALAAGLTVQAIATTHFVTVATDSGPGSLRDAVLAASESDTIRFDASLNGSAILLTTGAISTSKDLVFLGNGVDQTLIDGSNSSRVFRILTAGDVTMEDLTVQNGSAVIGAGIRAIGPLSMRRCKIRNCDATDAGGGIYTEAALDLEDCTFANNTSVNGGGAVRVETGTVAIDDCLFNSNSVDGNGGAIRVTSAAGTINIRTSTFFGNTALLDGGAISTARNATIRRCTITGNSADLGGGLHASGSANLKFTGSIVAGNIASFPFNDLFWVGSMITSLGYNVLGINNGVSPASGDQFDTGLDPDLFILGDYGGFTRTMPPRCTSPAIDAGDPADFSLDQRGLPVSLARDVGACEIQRVVTQTATGFGTIRELVKCGDTITFDPVTDGTLLSGGLDIIKDATILGNGIGVTIVSGGTYVVRVQSTANVELKGVTVQNGFSIFSGFNGAGISNEGNLLIEDCEIQNNRCFSFLSLGAGIYTAGDLNIRRSVLHGNDNDLSQGGGIYHAGGSLLIENSTIHNNTAVGGSAIYSNVTINNLVLQNSTVYGNSSVFGATIQSSALVTAIIQSTITGNTSGDSLGAVYIESGNVSLGSSLITDNEPDFDYRQDAGIVNSEGYNLIGSIATPFSLDSTDMVGDSINPLLDSLLRDNGGPTPTLALLCGSPAIDAGNPVITTPDQRGVAVFGGRRDIGAFEIDTTCLPPACSIDLPPENLASSVGGSGVTLSWDAIPQSVACQVQGRPLGAPGFATLPPIFGFEPDSAFVPISFVTAGSSYEWKVRCACNLSPIEATGFSSLDTFSVPLIREVPSMVAVSLLPNPVAEQLSWNMPGLADNATLITLLIRGMDGRVVLEASGVHSASGSIDVSRLVPGLYSFELQVRGAVIREVFIRQ